MGSPYSPKANSMITCEVSSQVVDLGSIIRISGSLWPVHLALAFVQVSKDEGSTWENLAMATIENGNYSYLWTPAAAGSYLLRTFWAGDMDHKKMTSLVAKVEVKQCEK